METVRYEIRDSVAQVVFDRPQALNAIDVQTAEQFLDVCRRVLAHEEVRVLVLRGEGRSFMAGGDLAAFASAEDPSALASAIIRPLNEALVLLAEAEQPVIGSVQGPVSGAGMSIALGCDLTLAARTTRFCPAYLAIAASLDAGGSWHLVRQLGLQRAMQVALLNQVVSADQALAWGLVSQVVEPELLAEVTDELATRLARGPRHAQGQVKSLLRGAMNRDFSSQLVAEHDAFVSCASQADFREGVSAFFDKRDAHY